MNRRSTGITLFSALSLCLCSSLASAQFHDDFTGSKLDPAWTWSDPGNDASFKLGALPGRFRMIVPPGNDHTTGHRAPLYAGPMLTVPAKGDFTITTHVAVNYPPVPAAKESGLMIWKDRSNNLQFKRTNAFNSQNLLYYGNIANARTSFHGNIRLSANELYLRITRKGATFTAFHSLDGKNWTRDASVNWNVSGTLNVGIATSFWLWFGTNKTPATGDYLFFDLETPKATLSSLRAGISASGGGTIDLPMDMGVARAGEFYFLLGSLSGTKPGFKIGNLTVPLNSDALTNLMLSLPNLPGLFPNTFGKLDSTGRGVAKLIMPAGLLTPLVGRGMSFAAVIFPPSLQTLHATTPVELAIAK